MPNPSHNADFKGLSFESLWLVTRRSIQAAIADHVSGATFSTGCKLGALQKARLKKVHFSGDFLSAFDFLRSACSLEIPLKNLQI